MARMLAALLMPIREELAAMEQVLSRVALSDIGVADAVVRHVMLEGGKRLRPAIFFLAARVAGAHRGAPAAEGAAEIAAALELLHAASLLHDDVIDGAQTRRGCAAAPLQWGERASILVGDYLWGAASRLLVRTNDARLLDMMAATAQRMAEAELLELDRARSGSIDRSVALRIVEGKTASLFAAAARAGAIIARAGAPEEAALAAYGQNMGFAFQLADDALDCDAGALHMRYGGRAAALELAQQYAREACKHLAAFPLSPEREALAGIASDAARRDR
jgi:octaprenyl-diphosphate synthase